VVGSWVGTWAEVLKLLLALKLLWLWWWLLRWEEAGRGEPGARASEPSIPREGPWPMPQLVRSGPMGSTLSAELAPISRTAAAAAGEAGVAAVGRMPLSAGSKGGV